MRKLMRVFWLAGWCALWVAALTAKQRMIHASARVLSL